MVISNVRLRRFRMQTIVVALRVDAFDLARSADPGDGDSAEPPAKPSLNSNAVEAPSSSMQSLELALHPDQGEP